MGTLSKRDLTRRTIILCCSCARNLAFYRAGQTDDAKRLMREARYNLQFWREVNSGFLNSCVLDWCNLFGDKKATNDFRKVVADPAAFEAELLRRLGITGVEFDAYVKTMREYRDKFVAHLDDKLVMNIPKLDHVLPSIAFYHDTVMAEADPADVMNMPSSRIASFDKTYRETLDGGESVYRHSLAFDWNS